MFIIIYIYLSIYLSIYIICTCVCPSLPTGRRWLIRPEVNPHRQTTSLVTRQTPSNA